MERSAARTPILRLSILAFGLVLGCAKEPRNDLANAEHVRTWATTGSALAAYATVYDAIAFADGEHVFPDPACPRTMDDGTTVTIAGGCTDSESQRWFGNATVTRSGEGDRMVTLDGHGHSSDDEVGSTGTASLTRVAASEHRFTIDLVREGGITTRIAYAGTVVGDYDARTVWNGEGQVERDGFAAPTGSVRVRTTDQVVDDDVCSGQPVSGQTTIEGEGPHTAVVTYDGETDCDDDQAARWSYDGMDQGTITGIVCGVGAGPGRPGHLAPVALLVLAAALTARRSRLAR
jgi:hypothetical protein